MKIGFIDGGFFGDPKAIAAVAEMIREELAAELYKRSLAATWPEVFDGVDSDAMSKAEVERLINHHLLYGDGTNKPRGIIACHK